MPPLFCCSIADLSLQLLQRQKETRREHPLLVVSADRPGGRVTACNLPARELGVQVGMRYSEALSLSERIVAGVVSAHARRYAMAEIRSMLESFLPAVEAWELWESVLWGDMRGMARLGGDAAQLSRRIGEALRDGDWICGTAVGWTRPGTLFAAHAVWDVRRNGRIRASRIFSRRHDEIRWYMEQDAGTLPLDGRDRERLGLLGIRTVSDLLTLGEETLSGRFTPSLRRFFRFLRRTDDSLPVATSHTGVVPVTIARRYEPPLRSVQGLMERIRELVREGMKEIIPNGWWVRGISITLTDDHGGEVHEEIACGHPSRDEIYLLRLIGARLENARWSAREIQNVTLLLQPETPSFRQGTLQGLLSRSEEASFSLSPDSLSRIHEVFALLGARLGEHNVFRILLQPARIPERRFTLEGGAGTGSEGCGVTYRPQEGEDESAEAGEDGGEKEIVGVRTILTGGPQVWTGALPPRLRGPYVLTSEWWNGDMMDRLYTYNRERSGRTAWLFRPVDGKEWMVQGWLT